MAIEVRDTGCGIDPADHTRIFEAFERGDQPAAANEKSLGLGLAISDRLARLHGGYIELESEPGRGAAFRLLLPRFEATALDLADLS